MILNPHRYSGVSATRIIAIVVLLVVAAHLFLFGWLRRRIAEARRQQESQETRRP